MGEHPNRKRSEQYRLHPASASEHRWFYFPHMHKDELLIFKQYDSDPNASARYCFHTAFNDPTIPVDAPARQSIEVRALALFSDTMTAPPAVVRNLSDEVFEARVVRPKKPVVAPAAPRQVRNAHGKRKMPVEAQQVDLDSLQLSLAIEMSLVDLS